MITKRPSPYFLNIEDNLDGPGAIWGGKETNGAWGSIEFSCSRYDVGVHLYLGRVVVWIGIIFEHVGPGNGSTIGEEIGIGKTNDIEMGSNLLDVIVAHFITDLVSCGFVIDRCLDKSVSDVGALRTDNIQLGGERRVVNGKHERQGSNHIGLYIDKFFWYLPYLLIMFKKKIFFIWE